ncbi:hypothetical protein [Olleya sp. UBA1516]|uniref:hypothetical protein n=1 Tax=Olleya sp. UBA1516 TaxID=1947013 RepID=UPI0025ED9355|nr:hypothetical protein [Olleya sp. UBA1516]
MHKLMTLITIIFLTSCTDHIIDSTTSKITLAFQDKQDLKPKHLKHFIPEGYTIIRTGGKLNKVKAYLNTDDIYDYAVLLSNGTQHNAYADATRVTLAIFEGQKDGTFKLKSQTGNLTYAFIYTSVEKQLTVLNNNVITLKHQSMRHDYQLKFKYQTDYENYMLIGSDYNNYGNAMHIGAGKVTTNFIYGIRKSTIDYVKMTYSNKDLYPISMVNNDNVYDLISD